MPRKSKVPSSKGNNTSESSESNEEFPIGTTRTGREFKGVERPKKTRKPRKIVPSRAILTDDLYQSLELPANKSEVLDNIETDHREGRNFSCGLHGNRNISENTELNSSQELSNTARSFTWPPLSPEQSTPRLTD